ncbi:MAG: ABC transporter substrate-binding protein [Chlorobiaceae bacterium]|nr:ABC transporter substrate-binding protein [Chlorobiaceae bacterium]
MNKKLKIVIPALLAVLIAFAWWFAARKESASTKPVAVREVQTTAPNNWELVKKLTGRDILAEEGVKVEPVFSLPSNLGTTSIQALLANNIDIGGAAWPSFINAVARGGKVRAVINMNVTTRDNESGTSGLLVLEGSDIHSIKDLAGKRIALNGLGAEADYVIRQFLKKNGLSVSEVELVTLQDDKQEQMLRNRQIDAAAFSGSGGLYFDKAVENGGVRQIPGTTNYDTKGESVLSGMGFRSDFIEKHPDVVRRYIHALDAARRIVYEEFHKDPERVRKAYAEISIQKGANPELAKYYRATRWNPNFPVIVDKDIQWWFDRLAEDGTLKPGQLKPSDIYTNEFIDQKWKK